MDGLALWIVALGIAGTLVGTWLLRGRVGSGEGVVSRPLVGAAPVPESQWAMTVVHLALELSRSDGAMAEEEFASLEGALTGGTGGLEAAKATELVHSALKSTIEPAGLGAWLDELRGQGTAEQRAWALEVLERVAGADGAVTSEEQALLGQVRDAFKTP